MRRFIALLAAAALTIGLTTFAANVAQAKTTKPTPISVNPTTPTQGQPFTISGKIGTKVKRPITAQYKTGTTWKTLASGKTTAKGAYQLRVTTSASSLVVRVVAKKVKIKHKTYKKVTTKTRTITPTAPPVTTLVSGSASTQANAAAISAPAISADGRYVAFASLASNLVAGDTNSVHDVFVRDRSTGAITRASIGDGGAQGNSHSVEPSITPTGRYVAFASDSSNLVFDDTNGAPDIFVRDRLSNTTTLVSVATNGAVGNGSSRQTAISDDGRYVAFASEARNLTNTDTNYQSDIFVRDLVAHTTTQISAGVGGNSNGGSHDPAISADGRYVAFDSTAYNLVSGDTNYETADVFVRDLSTGITTLVSVSSSGGRGNRASTSPSISADGRYVAFSSDADNLVSGDTNYDTDVFVRDLVAGTTTRVSVSAAGAQGDGTSHYAAISADGRHVAFTSGATNLISGGPTSPVGAVFVRDLTSGAVTWVSATASGAQPNAGSANPAISADGSWIAFLSDASNLVSGDTNSHPDIFERGPLH